MGAGGRAVRRGGGDGEPRERPFRQTGSVAPRPHGGEQPQRVDDEVVRVVVESERDATREDLAAAYARRTGVMLGVATVGRSLVRLGFTRNQTVVSA